MRKSLPQLGGAPARIWAPIILVTLLGRTKCGSTGGAQHRHHKGAFAPGARLNYRAENFGYDITGLAQIDHVADQHTLALHLKRIMQSGHGNARTCDFHWFHDREWRNPPGPAHINLDINEPGTHDFWRVLIGDCPTRCPCGLT